MAYKYKVKAAADRQGIQTLAGVTARTTLQMQNLIPRILFLGGGLAVVVFKGAMPWLGKPDAYQIFCTVTGVTLVALGLFGDRINRWNAWRLAQRAKEEVCFLFEDARFLVERQGQATPRSYEGLYAVYELPEAFALFLTAKEGYLLRHSDFQEGNPLLFLEFLKKKQVCRIEKLDMKPWKN